MIAELKSKIIALKNDLPSISRAVIMDNSREIIRIYQDNQIGLGKMKGSRKDAIWVRGHDGRVHYSGAYTPATEARAEDPHYRPIMPKDAGARYNFQWTGGFFAGMHVIFQPPYNFAIYSRDGVTPILLDIFGDLFTLTDENLQAVDRLVEADFSKRVNQRLEAIV